LKYIEIQPGSEKAQGELMNRWVAFVLLIAIAFAGWQLFNSSAVIEGMASANSQVLFTYGKIDITVAWLFWAIIFVVGWLTLVTLGYAIDPILGYMIFRIGLEIIVFAISLGTSSKSDSKSGSGSGRSGRGG